VALNPAERAELRPFLVNCFSLADLKDLAFDLGVDFQTFPHQTTTDFVRELISYFEHRDQMSCLVIEVLRRRHSDSIARLLRKLSPCWPGSRMQIIVDNDLIDDVSDLLGDLADRLKIRESEISLLGANWGGGVRLLKSVPEGDKRISVPLVSRIAAGVGIHAGAESYVRRPTIELPLRLLADTEDLFAVQVSSDVKEALLHRDDIVILRRQEQVEDGEMACVSLLSQDEIVVRQVYYEEERVRLQPADPTMDPAFVPLEEVMILGRVVMVIRGDLSGG